MRWIRSVRTRLLLVVLTAVSLGLVVATIGFNLLIASSTDSTEISRLRQRANEERELMQVANGVPVKPLPPGAGTANIPNPNSPTELTPAREGQQANAGARGRPGAAEIRTLLENASQNQKK